MRFRFFRTRSTTCFFHIRAFALIPFMEYVVLFPSIFVDSLVLGFIEDGFSFATQAVAFLGDCSFHSKVCTSVSSLPSACVKKNCSSSATSEDDFVTSMGVFGISSRILTRMFSVTSSLVWGKSQLLC